MSEDTEARCRRFGVLKGLREPHEANWAECYRFTHPERADGLNSSEKTSQQSQAERARIFDTTANESGRTLSSAMQSGTTPPNSRWFDLNAGQESDDEARWMDSAAQRTFELIHSANFDASAFECTTDMVDVGWFVLYTDEDQELGGLRFEQWPIAQCYVSASKAGGIVDTLYRYFKFSVEQTVNTYGLDKVSPRTRELWNQQKFDEMVEILMCIEPRTTYVVNARLARNLPFSSHHIELAGRHELRESGYHEFPCAVARWRLIPGTHYATGPTADALPTIKTLNKVVELELSNLDIAVAGMWKVVDDGTINLRNIKVGARRVVPMADTKNMEALTTGTDFNVAFLAEDRLQAQIRRLYLADELQPQDGPAMTATEVHARVQKVRQLLGPIFGRLQTEYLQPLVARCFGLALRAGALGMPPESLQNRLVQVRYISPLARAQQYEEVQAIDDYVARVVQSATAAQDVSILDNVDFDAAAEFTGKALGVPSQVIPSDDAKAAKRQQRADAAKQAQATQQQAVQQQQLSQAMADRMAKAA